MKSRPIMVYLSKQQTKGPVMKKIPIFLLLVLVQIAVVLPGSAECGQDYPPASNFTLPDLQNKPVSLSDFKGKVILLNFWASWCTPCRLEIPGFVELQKKYGPSGLAIVGVSIDKVNMKTVKDFSKRYKINYTVLYAGPQAKKIIKKYGNFRGIPTTFLIDRQGRVIRSITGLMKKEFWESEIKKLL